MSHGQIPVPGELIPGAGAQDQLKNEPSRRRFRVSRSPCPSTGEAIIRNLPEKTGKSLDERLTVLTASALSEKRALKEELKTVHGVGHSQAQTIVKVFLKS